MIVRSVYDEKMYNAYFLNCKTDDELSFFFSKRIIDKYKLVHNTKTLSIEN